jgi:hypothetical protein
MALRVFSNIVADPNATNPGSLNLTTKNNGVTATSFGANANAILFNAETTQTGNNVIQFLINGVTTAAQFASSYNGKTVAVLLKNGNGSYTYTLNTAQTVQTASADNGFESISPEKLRLWNLNG